MTAGPSGRAAYFTDDAKHVLTHNSNKRVLLYCEWIVNYNNKQPFTSSGGVSDALFKQHDGEREICAIRNQRMFVARYAVELTDSTKQE
jgi:hypothetical protein